MVDSKWRHSDCKRMGGATVVQKLVSGLESSIFHRRKINTGDSPLVCAKMKTTVFFKNFGCCAAFRIVLLSKMRRKKRELHTKNAGEALLFPQFVVAGLDKRIAALHCFEIFRCLSLNRHQISLGNHADASVAFAGNDGVNGHEKPFRVLAKAAAFLQTV